MLILLAFVGIAAVGLLICGGVVLQARRLERRRTRRLSARLRTEEQIELLTAQTLQAMRQAVREQVRSGW
jgi:nitrate reductase gamma subunit